MRPGVPDCQIHLNVPAGNVAGRIITNAPSAFFTVVMLIIIGRKSNEPANQFGKKRKACQYVTCIGTMLFFDGTGNPCGQTEALLCIIDAPTRQQPIKFSTNGAPKYGDMMPYGCVLRDKPLSLTGLSNTFCRS